MWRKIQKNVRKEVDKALGDGKAHEIAAGFHLIVGDREKAEKLLAISEAEIAAASGERGESDSPAVMLAGVPTSLESIPVAATCAPSAPIVVDRPDDMLHANNQPLLNDLNAEAAKLVGDAPDSYPE